ncbi:MAG: hypothetical protein U0167_06760 [bacterium]
MRFTPRHSVLLLLVATLPVEVDVPPAPHDRSETTVRFYGGGGQYALVGRGCDAPPPGAATFGEVGAAVQHRARNAMTVGVDGAYVRDEVLREPGVPLIGAPATPALTERRNVFAISPHLGWEPKWVGLEVGVLAADAPLHTGDLADWWDGEVRFAPAGHLRLGSTRSIYTTVSFLDRVPLYSASYLQFGVGYGGFEKVQSWVGLGAVGPNDGAGFLGKVDVTLSPRWTLNTDIRLGSSEGIDENAAAVGLTVHHVSAPASDVR